MSTMLNSDGAMGCNVAVTLTRQTGLKDPGRPGPLPYGPGPFKDDTLITVTRTTGMQSTTLRGLSDTAIFILIAVPLCIPSVCFAAEDVVLLDAELARKDTLEALHTYCDKVEIGAVKGPGALSRLHGSDLDLAKQQVTRGRSILRSLAILIPLCVDSSATKEDKIAILRQLMILRGKVQHEEHLGIGSLELSNAISMTIAGLFLQIYDKNQASDQETLLAIVSEPDRCRDKQCVLWALIEEEVLDDGDNGPSLYDLLIGLADLHRKEADGRYSDLDMTFQKLMKSDMRVSGSFGNQLRAFDRTWFAWDVLNATRLLAMCKLCIFVAQAKRADEHMAAHKRLEKAVSHLDDFERTTLWAILPTSHPLAERNTAVWLHVKSQLSSQGREVLNSVQLRLEGETLKEPAR